MSRFGMFRTRGFSLLAVAAVLYVLPTAVHAADIIEGFDDVSTLTSKGWAFQNLSNPLGVSSWFQGDGADPDLFPAQAGPVNSYIGANYLNAATVGTISNWMFTPTNTYQNGDILKFWSRVPTGSDWSDHLEVRLSTSGSSVNVGNTALSVGDFSTVLMQINPDFLPTGYPDVWTEFSVTLSGLAGPTSGRIAFRYFVTDSGPDGDFGDFIGIDTLRITTVPEPSTYALAMISVGLLAVGGRRMKSRNKA